MVKVVIAGGRDFKNYGLLSYTCDSYLKGDMTQEVIILSGKAKGADTLGERYANENKIAIEVFPADWDKHGKSAGFIRNKQMVDVADMAIIFWDGKSKGTKHTIDLAHKKGIMTVINMY